MRTTVMLAMAGLAGCQPPDAVTSNTGVPGIHLLYPGADGDSITLPLDTSGHLVFDAVAQIENLTLVQPASDIDVTPDHGNWAITLNHSTTLPAEVTPVGHVDCGTAAPRCSAVFNVGDTVTVTAALYDNHNSAMTNCSPCSATIQVKVDAADTGKSGG